MENHIVVEALLFLSIVMLGTLNSSEFELEVANQFTSGKTIQVRVERGGHEVVGRGLIAQGNSRTWSITDRVPKNKHMAIYIKYKCHVTELGEGKLFTYYGFFNFSCSDQLLDNSIKSLVNEEGAFMYSETESSGYKLLYSWFKLEFYVYNKFEMALKFSLMVGDRAKIKTEKVEPGEYMHWTRVIIEPSNIPQFRYRCAITALLGRGRKVVDVFESSSIDASLLQQRKAMYYTYAVKDDGIGVYDPATSEYKHLRGWSLSKISKRVRKEWENTEATARKKKKEELNQLN